MKKMYTSKFLSFIVGVVDTADKLSLEEEEKLLFKADPFVACQPYCPPGGGFRPPNKRLKHRKSTLLISY
jgi:hypothetical protein